MVEWCWQGKPEELGEKPVPVPICPLQIPHGLTRAWTRDSAVKGRRLTTWAMARPILGILSADKARPERDTDYSPPFNVEVKNEKELLFPLPLAPTWCSWTAFLLYGRKQWFDVRKALFWDTTLIHIPVWQNHNQTF